MALAKHITAQEQIEVTKAYLAGIPPGELAKKFGRCPSSISRILKGIKTGPASEDIKAYRESIKVRSYQMVEMALTPTKDQDLAIKAAPTALSALKGLGELDSGIPAGSGIAITINLPSSLALPDGMIDVTPRRALPHVVVEGSESNCDLAKCNGLNKPNF